MACHLLVLFLESFILYTATLGIKEVMVVLILPSLLLSEKKKKDVKEG